MGTLRGIHKTRTDPRSVLAMLNQRLMQRPLSERFCSTLYAVFDPSTRTLAFSNAGIPFPQLLSKGACQALGQGGLPSGMFPDAAYDQHVVQLSRGDSVLFATDGLYESCNHQGIEFCTARMEAAWAQCQYKSAGESLDFLFEGLRTFSNGSSPQDDITAVVLKVLP